MKAYTPFVLAPMLLLARNAFADEAAPADTAPDARIGVTANAGPALFHRSSTSPTEESGFFLGGEVRVHPLPMHGFVLGYTRAAGLFGPKVTILDAAYSLQLVGPRRLEGVTGALYLDIGPSAGFAYVHSEDPTHAILGGRFSVGGDLQITNFVLGAFVTYRGGIPIGAPDGWEGALTCGLRVGLAFDIGGRAAPER